MAQGSRNNHAGNCAANSGFGPPPVPWRSSVVLADVHRTPIAVPCDTTGEPDMPPWMGSAAPSSHSTLPRDVARQENHLPSVSGSAKRSG